MTRHALALVHGDTKLVVPRAHDGHETAAVVYGLARDPAEAHPDAFAQDGVAKGLAGTLAALEARLASRASPAQHEPLEARTRERLRALGYAN